MQLVALVVDVVLAGYIAVDAVRFVPRYQFMKQAIANGDTRARVRLYQGVLWFEWISALLAFLALGFDWGKLNPSLLGLNEIPLLKNHWQSGTLTSGIAFGMILGVAFGATGFIVVRIKAKRRGDAPKTAARTPGWHKLVPDFSALIPVTAREKLLWLLIAVSAGVCEEIVFRGWLLSILHASLGLNGTVLVVAAAAIFGLAHIYQRATGVALTTVAGALFCVLYVASGSLLLPILLHVVVDARLAVLPAPAA